jgi:hypothetical protein
MYDPGQLYVDPILSNFSTGFQDQTLYGMNFMPLTPTRTQSGRYRVFDRSDWLTFESRREPGMVARTVRGRKWSEDTFSTQEHSLAADVHDEELQELYSQGGLADPVFGGDLQIDPYRDATELVTRALLLEHEDKVAGVVRDAANYPVANTVTLTGAEQWDDYTFVTALDEYSIVSDPVGDILTGMRTIWSATRRYPNLLAIPTMGASYIENHPRIVARFKNFALTEPDAFRRLTGFDGRIILVDSLRNTANNVDDTEVLTDFWGKDVWLGISDPTPGQKTQTFGKTFAQVYPNGKVRPTDRWREENRKTDVVRTSFKYDLKIVSDIAGYLIKTAFSASAF